MVSLSASSIRDGRSESGIVNILKSMSTSKESRLANASIFLDFSSGGVDLENRGLETAVGIKETL
jgi:hypothetical protein